MDKRIEKTKKALCGAFLQLRAKKPVRSIKIAELCQLAEVNKTTFYSHYKDIYELAEDVEKQLLYKIIGSIPRDMDYSFSNPGTFTREVSLAFERHIDELNVLFDRNDMGRMSVYIEAAIKKVIFSKYPQLRSNDEINIILSYCIHGAISVRLSNPNLPFETIMTMVEKMASALQPIMESSLGQLPTGN